MARWTGAVALMAALMAAAPAAFAQSRPYAAQHQAWSVYCDACASLEDDVCAMRSGNVTVAPFPSDTVYYDIALPAGASGSLTFLVDRLAPVTVPPNAMAYEGLRGAFRIGGGTASQLVSLFGSGRSLRVVFVGPGGQSVRDEISLAGFVDATNDVFAVMAQIQEDQVTLACGGVAPPGPGTPPGSSAGAGTGATGVLTGPALAQRLTGNSVLGTDLAGTPFCRFYGPGGVLSVSVAPNPARPGGWEVDGSDVCHLIEDYILCERFSFPTPNSVFYSSPDGSFTGTAEIRTGNKCG